MTAPTLAHPLNVLAVTAHRPPAHLAPHGLPASLAATAQCLTAPSLVARPRIAHPHPLVRTLVNAVSPVPLRDAPATTVLRLTALAAPLTPDARPLTSANRQRTV